MDKIHIRDLVVRCIIGTEPKERIRKQNVVINLDLECDHRKPAASDRIEDAINYKIIRDKVVTWVRQSRCELLECLADKVAAICLEDRRIKAVTVVVDKPGALTLARSVAVELRRPQPVARRRR